ncbi:MAG: sensor histidine kinase [Candidatus Marinimicrobia bacterium]|jgi:K+-sensing histidine kinase KdpD|nr:sensor histidine kinase [Candidatus Neomarinimicrobiota bacterium]MBT3575541.1 sensor histidine kinase [Candidatus Neomarinimicrobiota bacterium]MBT3679638.1 sensor histidine kinase [Candidatus Neomarinimicrobiota bacterium]MBT3950595.1 sensor histidine kinase [Candidatus Neomarinimicrobiota bacterium]MBT4253418.1 sensor histidine kinase [Candidatus Neomarinimicrobiota bacterium]
MDSYFATAERATAEQLHSAHEIISQSIVVEGLLETVGGLLAVLNEQRQIISLNDSFLKMLGVEDPMHALGLRPGNALDCIHAQGEPAGCGTTKYCSTCGTVKAIMASLETNKAVEDTCALKAKHKDEDVDLALKVRSHPITIEGSRFIMLFLQDITLEQRRAALERTFFHDINNMLSGLVGASELLAMDGNKSPMVDIVRRSSLRLQKAVEIQRFLLDSDADYADLLQQSVSLKQIREDLTTLFLEHPSTLNKTLNFSPQYEDFVLLTDISLLERVLANMITNALEASEAGERVDVSIALETDKISFSVHNNQIIPDDVRLRVFQRNFSTKGGSGRGLGTFSMKLFGEKILGGKVSFTSRSGEGTVFTISLPL